MTKIFYGRDLIGRFNCDGRKHARLQVWVSKIKTLTKRSTMALGVISLIGWGFYWGTQSVTRAEVIVPVKEEATFPVMLMKICKAESNLRQFKANGDVLRGKVEPSDIGYCQINETIWNDKARKLGLDIYTEKGNKDMALYIFNNYGSDPWNSSRSMWSK